MLIGYVSDEQHVAIADAQLEFASGDQSIEVRSRASGAVHADVPPGRWSRGPGCAGVHAQVRGARRCPGHGAAPLPAPLGPAARLLLAQVGAAGERVELRMHATEPYRASIWRYGWTSDQVADLGRFDSFGPGGDRQVVPDGDFTVDGCRWNENGYPFGPDARNVHRRAGPNRALLRAHRRPSAAARSSRSRWSSRRGRRAASRRGRARVHDRLERLQRLRRRGRTTWPPANCRSSRPSTSGTAPYLRDTGGRFWNRPNDDYDPLSFDRPEPVNRIDEDEQITTPCSASGGARRAGVVAPGRLAGARGDPDDLYAENAVDMRAFSTSTATGCWSWTSTRSTGRGRCTCASRRGSSSEAVGWRTWAATGSTARSRSMDGGRATAILDGDQSYWVPNRDFTGGPFSFSPRRIERAAAMSDQAVILGDRDDAHGHGHRQRRIASSTPIIRPSRAPAWRSGDTFGRGLARRARHGRGARATRPTR